jgi:AcrR family transcriptional regulator
VFDPGHADAGTSRRGSASSLRPPQRSHALWNHARILAAACEELGRNPSASLDEIARAVGVARRTVYEHFPSRQALIAALAGEATQTVAEAFAATAVLIAAGVAPAAARHYVRTVLNEDRHAAA